MNNELNFYLPNLEDTSAQKYTLIMKDKSDNNLESSVVSNKFSSFEEIMNQYKSLKTDNNDDDFFIVTEQTAKAVANDDKFSHNDWVKIINETYAKLGIQNGPLLTHEQLVEQKQKDKYERAKALGLVNEDPVPTPVVIEPYLPKLEENSAPYCFVVKDKTNDNLQQITVDQDMGSLDVVKKLVSVLNNNVNDKEYYVVTPKFAAELPTLDNDVIAQVINQTQELIGNPLRVNSEAPPQQEIQTPATSREKLSNPGINEILASDEPEGTKTAPNPEQVNKNYQHISQQFSHINQKQLEAKMKKSPLSKSMMATTVGLIGVSILSIPLAPIALPAAFVVGTSALIKAALFKGNKSEVKEWEKRKELLTEAALDYVGAKVDGKKKPKLEDMQALENIIFTPEIQSKYKELCKKAKLAPSMSEKITNIRNSSYTSNSSKKTHDIK